MDFDSRLYVSFLNWYFSYKIKPFIEMKGFKFLNPFLK